MKKFIRVLAVSLALGLTSQAYPGGIEYAPPPPLDYSHPYAGIGGGYHNAYTNAHAVSTPVVEPPPPPQDNFPEFVEAVSTPNGVGNLTSTEGSRSSVFTHQSNNGGFGILFAGYHVQSEYPYFINFEVFGTLNSLSSQSMMVDCVMFHRLGIQNSFGGSVNPGAFLTPNTQLFTRFGVVGGRFKATSSHHDLRKTLTGAIFGIGVQRQLSPRWAVRAEFDHTNYCRFGHDFENGTHVEFKPRTYQAWLAVVWRPRSSSE